MSATAAASAPTLRRVGDTGALIIVALVLWQGLYEVVGDVALTPPIATFAHAGALLRSGLFLRHVAATADASARIVVLKRR